MPEINAKIVSNKIIAKIRTYKIQAKINGGVGIGGGTTDHTQLQKLHADDQHPITSVIGLYSELEEKLNTNSYIDGGTF